MPASVRDGLHMVLQARRDVRRYRPDPVAAELVRRVLEAAHSAPSVGHSQPWRFVVVQEQTTRDRAAQLADRERQRQADQLTPDRRQRLLDLQLEGIREAPVGIVVACDRRAPAAGVLGRATFPDADLWSCACAIQNLWLAARAEGLGVGWVTLFRPEDLAALLGLPPGVETLGWLCLGWPDERPPAPGLERAGWSRRLPLDEVLITERWSGAGPDSPTSHRAERLHGPTPAAVVAARDEADRRLTPVESLGVLDRYVDKALATGPLQTRSGTLVLVGADHPIAALGVSAYQSSVTRDVLRATVTGTSLGAVAARLNGLDVLTVDARDDDEPVQGSQRCDVGGRRGDLVHTDALSRATAEALVDFGRRLATSASPHGLIALGEVGVGNTTVAAALAGALLGISAQDAVGLGAASDTNIVSVKTSAVEAALARTAALRLTDPLDLLAALGGADVAILTGVVLGSAAAGVPVVLDGLLTSIAAVIAVRLEPAAARFLIAGHRSREKAHPLVLQDLGLEPLLELRLRSGEGVGACLAAGLLLQGIALRRDVALTVPAGKDRLTSRP